MRVCVLTMCCLVALFGAGVATSVIAAPSQQSTSDTAIPVMPLDKALNAFAQREHLQLVYVSKIADGVRTKGAPAGLSPEATLRKLLEGTGLGYRFLNAKTVTIYTLTEPQTSKGASTKEPAASAKAIIAEEPTVLDAVSVTGTRIKGGTVPSPVITIGSERIQEEGFTDLGEVIRSIPQNFSGGQNPGVIGAVSGIGNQDTTGGSALNLRGLGADASLTLLNGRRMAYDGFNQALDISAIPVDAVERLEIVPDGASAIYGSDAVGGVANVILKRDFDGVTVGARYGGATDGGLATREYTATAGATWAGGGLIATFKDADVDPIYADQRSYTRYLTEPYTIYSGSDSRNGLVSVHQSLGDVAELRLDAIRNERDSIKYNSLTTDSYYRFSPKTSLTLVSPSIAFSLRNDWSLTLGGTYGKDDYHNITSLMSMAGSGRTSRSCYCNKSRSWEVGAEGPLFPLGGGDAHLAVGVGSRINALSYTVPQNAASSYGGDERAKFAYAELNFPFVSPSSSIAGVRRLEFVTAVRGEDYDSFGRVVTPKLGVIYDPTADLTFKASWGKSFKAPTLLQRYGSKDAYLFRTSDVGAAGSPADATALMSYGGNADLRPERARTWTTSLAFHPQNLPGLETELTWFDIDYTDRVVIPTVYQQALSDPAYAGFVDRSPAQEEIQNLLAVYNHTFYNYAGVPFDASKVAVIIRDQYVNAARQQIKGLDLSGSYRFELGSSELELRGSASWLDSVQTTSAGQPEQTLAGTAFNPAKRKGRVGAVWTSRGFTASGFVNYIDGVTANFAPVAEKTASFTTLDTTVVYNTDEHAGAFSGLTLGLSVQNLLNRKPPLYTALYATYVPYDATNYSAIGRFVSVSVSKHW